MNIPKPKVKLPSKTRYMAQVNNFVPSNLHTQVQGSTGSLLSTASKTFPHNMFPQEVQSATLRRGNENENTENFDRTVKSNTETMRKPRVQSENKRKSVEEHQKKSSVLSGSSFSVQFSPVASKKNKKITNVQRSQKEERKPKCIRHEKTFTRKL